MSAIKPTHDLPDATPRRIPEDAPARLAENATLKHLLHKWIILPEEWDELAASLRQELSAIGGTQHLLARLVDCHLLTRFQAEAVSAGLTGELIIGQYRLLGLLGRGGMGTVYRAEHLHLRREVAVKILDCEGGGDPGQLHRFLLEARAVARLRHPHIVACLDAGCHKGAAAGATPATTT